MRVALISCLGFILCGFGFPKREKEREMASMDEDRPLIDDGDAQEVVQVQITLSPSYLFVCVSEFYFSFLSCI